MSIQAASLRDELVELDSLVEQRFISAREHPDAPLTIYNYTAKAQYEREWHPTTQRCRGLILHRDGTVHARPFPKFFNLGEQGIELPEESPEVWKKYDGSLGILYWINGEPAIASRGAFLSEQAIAGTRMLRDIYAASIPKLDRSLTYLFEIIYPENRIVVDYGATRELRLLTIVDTATGEEREPDPTLGFPVAERVASVEEMLAEGRTVFAIPDGSANEEGYVLFWRGRGLRLKVKFSEYVRVHHLVTGLHQKAIWEALRDGDTEILHAAQQAVPDIFRDWFEGTLAELRRAYANIEAKCQSDFRMVPEGDRKAKAEFITKCRYPAVLFRMLDGKGYQRLIWDLVRPERGFETFRRDGE